MVAKKDPFRRGVSLLGFCLKLALPNHQFLPGRSKAGYVEYMPNTGQTVNALDSTGPNCVAWPKVQGYFATRLCKPYSLGIANLDFFILS